MVKKISLKKTKVLLLVVMVLSMLFVYHIQSQQLDNIQKQKVTSYPILSNNVLPDNADTELLSDEISQQYEPIINQLKAQIVKAQSDVEITKDPSQTKRIAPSPQRSKEFGEVDQDQNIANDVANNAVRIQFDTFYKPLFNELNLSEETQEQLYAILEDRTTAIFQNNMDMINGTVSDMSEVSKLNEIATEVFNESVQEILSPSDYVAFQYLEETMTERMITENLNIYLGDSEQIDNDTEESLIKLMYEQRQNTNALYPENYSQLIVSAANDQEKEQYINEFRNRNHELYNSYLTTAEDVLSEPQLKVFNILIEDKKVTDDLSLKYVFR